MFTADEGQALLAETAARLGYALPSSSVPVLGLGGRTIAARVLAPGGAAGWLRLLSGARPGGKLWTGLADAERLVPDGVPRPRLLTGADLTDAHGNPVRADLLTHVPAPALSPSAALPAGTLPDLGGIWWKELGEAVAVLAAAPIPDGRDPVVSPAWVTRTIPAHLGVDADPEAGTWTLAHGDLHWANLTGTPLTLLDWEGFDAAHLLAYCLPDPPTAARVRAAFATDLAGPRARLARLAVAAMIVQAADRDPMHAALAPLVRADVADLLS